MAEPQTLPGSATRLPSTAVIDDPSRETLRSVGSAFGRTRLRTLVTLRWMAIAGQVSAVLFVIYARDLMVPYLRAFARQSGHDLQVLASGKIKTAVHAVAQIGIVAIALGVFGADVRIDGLAPTVLLLAAIAASIYSLADYVAEVGRLIRT